MINRKIDFTYYNNLKTGEWCQDAPGKYFLNSMVFNQLIIK